MGSSLRDKMWSPLIVFLVVGLATAENAWKPGYEYKYQIKGRTLAALHQVADKYVGVVSRATLTLQPQSSNAVLARISDAQFSPVQASLPGGWASRIPEKELNYKSLPLSSKPFQIKFKNGVVDELVVSKDLSNPEVNLIKSVVSQLQVDTHGENEIKWHRGSQAPKRPSESVFRAMEDTVTGKCEVMYDISPLPMYATQVNPELAPMPELRGDGILMDIAKTKNFSNCDKRVAYHYGITGLTDWEPADNEMGHFFSRSGVSRIVISGSLKEYTIQSSVTVNKVILSPALYNAQKGMVVSRMNVTLISRRSSSGSPPSVPNPQRVKDLVYDYNDPFPSERSSSSAKSPAKGNKSSESESQSSSSSENDSSDSQSNSQESGSSSSDSSESVERPGHKRQIPKRFRRSAPQQKNKNASSGSSSSSSENDSSDSVSNGEDSSSSESSSESQNSSNDSSSSNSSESNSSSSSRSSSSSSSCSSGSSSSDSESSSSESNDSDSNCSDSSSSSSSSSSESGSVSSASSSSSSSSSSSEEHNPKPGMNKAPKIPLLPYFIGYEGNAIPTSKDIEPVSAVKKLCSQIASELQHPSTIPQKSTLSKFAIVVRLVRTMNAEQLQKAVSQIYAPIKSSGENPWTVLRDALAAAGTGPCLTTIKDLIKSRKIATEEAAEIFATLAASARTPTAEFLKALFALATSPEVTKQPLLNSTAILSFANLARKAQVNNVTAHNLYPVHAFGRLSPINPKAVAEEYIPYMAKHLRAAVKDGDSHKIQVYIRALGNLGHPKILSVFEPYLEGKEPMSTFQRTLMVTSLNKLAKVFPQVARRVLFNVYQNLGESHEVRCAAVLVLMRTAPPAFMLQRMAEFTNRDPSLQVTAVVKSAIQSAAALQGPHHHEFKMNAKAAANLLNPKPLGIHYSRQYLQSYMVKEMGLAYRRELSWIGSSDGLLPSSAFISTRYNVGGWKSQNMALAMMTSSFNDLVDAVSDQFEDSDSSNSGKHGSKSGKKSSGSGSGSHSPFTTEKIAEMLNIEPSDDEQVEGNLLVRYMGTSRFFTFDNTTIENLPALLKSAASALRSGHKFNYNKLYNQFALTLAFPTETGLPFVYSIKKPTYISLRGEVQAKSHPDMASGSRDSIRVPETINSTASLQFVYSTRMTAKISFVAPLTHTRYIAGVQKNIQVNVPIKATFDLDAENSEASVTLQPLYNNREAQIFHYSTIPYTAKHNILDLTPVSQGSNFKPIHVREPMQMETTVGKDSTGFAFRVKYATEQKYLDYQYLYEKAQRHDAMSLILYPWAERTIKYNNINVVFDPQRSNSKSVTFTASYDDNSDDSQSSHSSSDSDESDSASNESRAHSGKSNSGKSAGSSSSSMANPSTSKPVSEKRQQEFLRRASSGIKNASASVLDLAVEFNGNKNIAYVATAAYASSEVDETSRALFYFYKSPTYGNSKPYEVCAAAKGVYPNVPLMNIAKALRANPTSYVSSEISFGEKCGSGAAQISISAKGEQSQERKEYIRRSPMAQKCMSLMQSGSYLQPACRNITARANFLDSYSVNIQYEKLPAAFKNFTYKAYSVARYLGYPYLDENTINVHNKEGKITVDIDFEPDLKAANVSLTAPSFEADFDLVRVGQWARPLAVQHPSWNAADRFLTYALHAQWTASCGLDRDSVSTFDNKTYPIHLGKCWHVMMTSQPEDDDSSSSSSNDDLTAEVTVLVRDASSHEKEVKVILGDDVFDLKPSGSSSSKKSSESGDADGVVYFNQKQRSVSYRKINNVTDSDGEMLAFWYALPSGAIIFEAPQHEIAIMYNGEAAWLEAGSTYRGDVLGLCGTYDSEPATDFTSPKSCILEQPKMFAASWAVPDQTCQGEAKEWQRRAASAPCFNQTFTPHDVITEEDANSGYSSRSSKSSRSSNAQSGRSSSSSSNSGCTQHRTKIIEQGTQTCFSMRPQPTCANNCRATGKVEKSVDVHCIANSSASRHFVEMVKKGANPDFSRKEVSKTIKISVPQGCTSN
ncbi:vitellogenin-A1-like [Ischnura elegans]|uniref:vitellogenin-A1-like n=1 Tax=Ischnura elegans TaxID=197161 RepID=UPI001ED8BCC1|nr:vitellogenin-A1-like [Ischnura elegans]